VHHVVNGNARLHGEASTVNRDVLSEKAERPATGLTIFIDWLTQWSVLNRTTLRDRREASAILFKPRREALKVEAFSNGPLPG
jgi:hypothetical protein